jgi:hypothetical protein
MVAREGKGRSRTLRHAKFPRMGQVGGKEGRGRSQITEKGNFSDLALTRSSISTTFPSRQISFGVVRSNLKDIEAQECTVLYCNVIWWLRLF